MSGPTLTPTARGDALGFVYQVAGQIVGLVLSLVSLTVVVHYLGRAQYGQVAAVVAFLGLWECLTDFGVGAVVVRRAARSPAQLREDVQVALGLSLSYCLLLASAAALTAWSLYGGRYRDIAPGVAVVSLGLAAATISSSWNPLFQRSSTYWPVALGDLAARLGTVALVVTAAVADWGPGGVLAAFGAGPIARFFVLALASRPLGAGRPVFAPQRWLTLLSAAVPLGAGQVIALVYYRVDAVLLSLLSTSGDVGSYGLALRLLAPTMFLPNLVLTGGLARLSAAHLEASSAFNALLAKLLRYVLVLAVPLVAVGIPTAPALVRLVGGADFTAAVGTVRLVVLATALVFVNAVWSVGLVAAGRQRLLLRLSLIGLGVNVAANLVLIPLLGAGGAAAALVLSEFSSVVVSYLALRRTSGLSVQGPRWHHLLGAAAAGFLLPALAPGGWAIPAAVLGGLLCLGLLLGSRFVSVTEVRSVLRRSTPGTRAG